MVIDHIITYPMIDLVLYIRLEVKSQKGSRNHFREDGMLTFVTHANY